MRLIVGVLVAVTSLLTAPISSGDTSFAGGGGTAEVDVGFVQRMLFDTSIADFTAGAGNRTGPDGLDHDTWFDWTTDLCSAPFVGNTGRSFNFTDACRRHDFGYRNTLLLDRRYDAGKHWHGDARKRIDTLFLADMKRHCGGRKLIDRPTCYGWAYTYYKVVRVVGGP